MSSNGPGRSRRSGGRLRLRALYDRLWSAALGRIRAGEVELDPILASRRVDDRRGLTVIVQPSPPVRRQVTAFLQELRRLEPDQYYYSGSEFHVTVLSLFTATADWEPLFAQQQRYVAAVDAALSKAAPIRIDFAGVTASAGTVMIQGFLENSSLNDLRDALRRQLRARGLGAGVDRRYRLRTAHMTVVRFRSPLVDTERFASALEQARPRPFGATTVGNLRLVEHDWYMSHGVTKLVKRYRLAPAG